LHIFFEGNIYCIYIYSRICKCLQLQVYNHLSMYSCLQHINHMIRLWDFFCFLQGKVRLSRALICSIQADTAWCQIDSLSDLRASCARAHGSTISLSSRVDYLPLRNQASCLSSYIYEIFIQLILIIRFGWVNIILATCIVPDGYRYKISPMGTVIGITFYTCVQVQVCCFSHWLLKYKGCIYYSYIPTRRYENPRISYPMGAAVGTACAKSRVWI